MMVLPWLLLSLSLSLSLSRSFTSVFSISDAKSLPPSFSPMFSNQLTDSPKHHIKKEKKAFIKLAIAYIPSAEDKFNLLYTLKKNLLADPKEILL